MAEPATAPQSTLQRAADGSLVLRLRFADEAGYFGWLTKVDAGMAIARLEERVEEGTAIVVHAECGAQRDERCGMVKQVFRSGTELWGTLLHLLPPTGGASSSPAGQGDAEAASGAESEQIAGPGDASEDAEDADVPETRESATRDEMRSASAIFDIKKLNPNQKQMLASKANRQQRQLLLRDKSVAVQMALLNNPQLEPKELIELIKNPQTSGGLLQRVANDQRWSGNYEVQLALVKNPQTPSPVALRMIDLMRTSDLRFLAKSQALRENVRKAALRVYLKRM